MEYFVDIVARCEYEISEETNVTARRVNWDDDTVPALVAGNVG